MVLFVSAVSIRTTVADREDGEQGHGRLEIRTLTCTDDRDKYLDWSEVRQVLRRECAQVKLKTGKGDTSGDVCDDERGERALSAAQMAELWQGHWTIENRRHCVRDVTMGEDGCQMHVGAAPQALAAVRNGLISILHRAGWTNIVVGMRHYSASLSDSLRLLGVAW